MVKPKQPASKKPAAKKTISASPAKKAAAKVPPQKAAKLSPRTVKTLEKPLSAFKQATSAKQEAYQASPLGQTLDGKVEREFYIKSGADNQLYWGAKSPQNGKVTFSGEGHPDLTKARRAVFQEMTALGATIPIVINIDTAEGIRTEVHPPAYVCPTPEQTLGLQQVTKTANGAPASLAQQKASSVLHDVAGNSAPAPAPVAQPKGGTVRMPPAKDHSGSQPKPGAIDMNQMKTPSPLTPAANPALSDLRRHQTKR